MRFNDLNGLSSLQRAMACPELPQLTGNDALADRAHAGEHDGAPSRQLC